MPTRDAENDRTRASENRPAVAVVGDGKPVLELTEILRAIAEHDLVLETGHSSASESLILIAAAKRAGVRAIVVTHVFSGGPTESQMAQMAGAGAIMECIYADDRAIATCAQAIKALGSDHFVLASDLGRSNAPLPTDGLRLLVEKLQAQGITPAQIDIMVRKNPARLLGLPLS